MRPCASGIAESCSAFRSTAWSRRKEHRCRDHLALAALLEPGDEVMLERPTYGLLADLARYFGATVRRIERRPEHDFALFA